MSKTYAEEGEYGAAAMSAHTALRLDPVQPEATRFMAGLMEREGQWGQAMELYGRLYHSGGGELEDLKKQAINAARGAYTDPARWLAGEVAKKGDPGFPAILEAELLLKKGDTEGARLELRKALEAGPSRATHAAMMRFILATGQADSSGDLLASIMVLKDGEDDLALEALAVGLASGAVPQEQRSAFIEKIRSHPKRTARVLMLADMAEVALDPESKARIAADMVSRLKGAPLRDRVSGALWLNSQSLPQQALELIPPEEALTDAAAMQAWIDTAAALELWDPMLAMLAREDSALPRHMARAYAGRAHKMAGRERESETTYLAALEEFRGKPIETAGILEYLHRSGEYTIFDQTLQERLSEPVGALDLVASLVPAVLDTRDSARLREVIAIALAAPHLAENVALLNDADYLDLVLGKPINTEALQERIKDHPGDLALLFTFALESLQAGQHIQSLALLEEANPEIRTMAPNHLTVLACVLAANNRKEEALAVASRIPATRISTQELDLLKKHLAAPPHPQR